jgi:rubrerythrin
MSFISKLKHKSQEIEQQLIILQALVENERKMHSLYAGYASSFPELKEFWDSIAHAETGHAEWLEVFIEKFKAGSCYFNKDRFNLEAIQTFGASIDKSIAKAKKDDMTLINALASARDFEMALLEKDFFKVFETDEATLKSAMEYLDVSTQRHIKMVQEKYEEYKPMG